MVGPVDSFGGVYPLRRRPDPLEAQTELERERRGRPHLDGGIEGGVRRAVSLAHKKGEPVGADREPIVRVPEEGAVDAAVDIPAGPAARQTIVERAGEDIRPGADAQLVLE